MESIIKALRDHFGEKKIIFECIKGVDEKTKSIGSFFIVDDVGYHTIIRYNEGHDDVSIRGILINTVEKKDGKFI